MTINIKMYDNDVLTRIDLSHAVAADVMFHVISTDYTSVVNAHVLTIPTETMSALHCHTLPYMIIDTDTAIYGRKKSDAIYWLTSKTGSHGKSKAMQHDSDL